MSVIKRDGTIVEFDKNKIKIAILKAMKSVGSVNENIAINISNNAEDTLCKNHDTTISDIEDYVYCKLVQANEIEIAKAYEGYRAVQEFKRKNNTTDESILSLVNRTNKEVMQENSNKNAVVAATQRDLIAGEVSKDIARRKLIPANVVQAHDEGILHYHDLDYAMQSIHNCMLIDLEDMLDNGTVINEKLVESPKSFSTACTVTTQIIAQIASNQYGGCSITIAHLAKYLRVSYDKFVAKYTKRYGIDTAIELANDRIREELKAGVQTIRYQLSTLQTTNGQAPFVTIYLEIQENDEYECEMALICEEMIKQRLEGMKNEKGQEIGESFPKLVYLLDEHNCLQGGKYDFITELCAVCNTKRLVPDYQSAKIMRKNYEGNTFPPMGCRSHLSPWKNKNGNYKWYGRFNIGVVSINLPQAALISKGNIDDFWHILDTRLELCKEALLIRYNLLKGTISDTSPIHWQHGAIARLEKGEKIDKLLENGFATISLGYVGVYECVQALLGVSHTTPDGEKLAVEILKKMKFKCDEWKKETGLGFGLYGTPGESLTSRFCKIDKEKFGVIKNVTDRMYYTNSYHVHVAEDINAFDKLLFESQFHSISSGGCISYIEVPNMSNNLEAIKEVIKFIYNNVQYAEINSKSDVCHVCGFNEEMLIDENLEWYCPACGNRDQSKMHVLRRTCGYLGSSFWGKGRTAEIKERVLHL